MKIECRKAKLSDVDDVFNIEKNVWGSVAATKEMIKSRIETFPEGSILAVKKPKIIGVVFFQIIDSNNELTYKNWNDYTDCGLIRQTHKTNGDAIFGVGLSVLNEYRQNKIGTQLLHEVINVAKQYKINKGMLGSRIPHYHKHSTMTVEEYISLRDKENNLVDPELRFYERFGLNIVKILPNYFPDPESKNYGILLEWKNLSYENM